MQNIIYTFRVALYTVLLLGTSFFAILVALVATVLGKRLNTNFYVARTFYNVAARIMGWKFEVEGEEYLWGHASSAGEGGGNVGKGGRSAVMVGNHQSWVHVASDKGNAD
jgi:phosphatidylinositol glycan class A protein